MAKLIVKDQILTPSNLRGLEKRAALNTFAMLLTKRVESTNAIDMMDITGIFCHFCVNFPYFILFNEYIFLFLHRVLLRHGFMPIEMTHKHIVELNKN